jgi:hypothetical protein
VKPTAYRSSPSKVVACSLFAFSLKCMAAMAVLKCNGCQSYRPCLKLGNVGYTEDIYSAITKILHTTFWLQLLLVWSNCRES